MVKSFFILLLTILLFLASFAVVVYRLQEPQFVVEQSRSVNLYGRLVSNVGQFLPSPQLKDFGLEADDVTEILKSGLDGEQFYGFMKAIGEAYLPWLTGRTNSLEFSYQLRDIKQKLTDRTETTILAKYRNLPLCTVVELRDWSFDNRLPSCQLIAGTLKSKSITNFASQAATKLTEGVPDSISLGQPSLQLQAIKIKVALAFKTIYAIWGTTLLVILLYLLLFRASGLISLSICFLLVGLLETVFSLIGWDWVIKTISDFVVGAGKAKSIVPVIIDLVTVILGAMKTVMGNISLGFLIAGGALLVLGIVSKVHQSAALLTKPVK